MKDPIEYIPRWRDYLPDLYRAISFVCIVMVLAALAGYFFGVMS